ncbi:MAG: hypothetical protein E6R13_09185 [Spirochaetes bacterium]|nr:MAG: hypothetical protein E6R13_09185 [Spirochaetota bacterium]
MDIQEKAKKNGDLCDLCHNVLNIKITPIRGIGCHCKQQMCESCFKSYLETTPDSELDSSMDYEESLKNCIMGCRIRYKNNNYLIADWTELSRLDELYGDIECPEGCDFKGSRKDYIKVHKSNCNECINCSKRGPHYQHQLTCLLCKETYPLCRHRKHIESECEAQRCEKCNILIRLHEKDKCKECGQIISDCESHYKTCVFSTKSGKSIEKCLKKYTCSKCGLAHFRDATSQCLSNISLMEKLGLETPYSLAIKKKSEKKQK